MRGRKREDGKGTVEESGFGREEERREKRKGIERSCENKRELRRHGKG